MSGNTDFIPPHVRKKQGGYVAMTGVLLGLVLLLSFMPLLAKETGRIFTGIEVKATAGQLSTVTAVVSDYAAAYNPLTMPTSYQGKRTEDPGA
mgnify:CR=1 FL=1